MSSCAIIACGAGRFAPSTSGPPHLGTLASALLVWLDAKQRGAPAYLRLEDLDPQRAKPAFAAAICKSLEHLGLVFDATSYQSQHHAVHVRAMDRLADQGALYACRCRRSDIAQRRSNRFYGSSYGYDNACRNRQPLGRHSWRRSRMTIRARLPQGSVNPVDLGGLDLKQTPAHFLGDPIVRRNDGSMAYIFASVVDDAEAGVGHVVRGRDLAPLSATQVALQTLLQLPTPTFRHHPILLDISGRKWSKSRLVKELGVGMWAHATGPALVGRLAAVLGLQDDMRPVEPSALVPHFRWHRVIENDVRLT